MAKADEKEMRRLQKIMAGLPKTEYTHSVVLLYEMLAARNPDVVEKLAGEQLSKVLAAMTPEERDSALKLLEDRLIIKK